MAGSSKKTRVGFYMYTPMLGGAEAYLKDLLWSLDRDRFEVVFYYESWPDFVEFLQLDRCPEIDARPVPVIEPGGHTHVPKTAGAGHSSNGRRGLKSKLKGLHKRVPNGVAIASTGLRVLSYSLWPINKKRLAQALSVDPVDVLHIVNGGYPGSITARIAAVVAKELGIPCAMTVCSTAMNTAFPRWIENKTDRKVFESVDTFITPADIPGQALVEKRNFDQAKFEKIYFGIQAPPPRDNSSGAIRRTRSELGIAADALVLGSVSTFSPLKGQAYLIEAFALLRSRFPQLRLVMVGDGPTLAAVKRRAVEKGVAEVTTFTGFYERVYEVISTFDIFVLPSELEGLPYVVLQAMSQKKPVVASRVGGIPEAVLPGETGLLVPPRNVESLAASIESLITDRQQAEEFGNNAYQRFTQNFTISQMVREHESLYQRLATIRN